MAGHSKWATTKRHKAAVDAKRGKIFSVISKEISLATRDGGKDPEFNPRLRTLITKAKQANMPADNIDRAIKKGAGELGGVTIEELLYEGYAPGGVGLIVEVTTDNKNRSASEVRSTFSKGGGNLAGAGALAWPALCTKMRSAWKEPTASPDQRPSCSLRPSRPTLAVQSVQ